MNQSIYEKLEVLKLIATSFNQAHICWNLGASANLYLRGIVDHFNDIDIMVHEKDIEKAKCLMSSMAQLKEKKPQSNFGTKHFYNYSTNHVDMDLMAGFAIKYHDRMYEFPLSDERPFDYIVIDKVNIYLEDISTWLMYYTLMERHDKIDIIQTYLKGERK